jgi:putative tryptophan/tyrosine transport system substrate-binding protein
MTGSRLVVAVTLTIGLLATPLAAEGQPTGRARIAILETSAPDPARVAWWDAFRQRMRELGYVEGQNVTFEARFAEGRIERLPALAAQFVKMKVDIIVTGGSLAAQAAKRATTSIPIVMATAADVVGLGIVASLARPGGNVTGVTSLTAELSGKRLSLLKEAVPRLSRVAFLLVEGDATAGGGLRDVQAAAGALDLSVSVFSVRRPYDFEKTFSEITRDGAEAVIVPSVAAYFGERKRIADAALKHHVPSIVGGKEYAAAGFLMSYGLNYPEQFRRVAVYVDKILKGAKPADLPIEQPTRFELVINMRTVKALGLTIPPSVLARADEIIE